MINIIPDENDMIALIGQSLYDVWQKLCAAIDEKYDMDRIWNSGGKAWTYEYKYRRGGKHFAPYMQGKTAWALW